MKIGIFDSGLGGLIIAIALIKALPEYDYLYLGDTAHIPYGNRPQTEIYQFTEQAVRYLFDHDCQLVIIACNTASAEALRLIQQVYLPAHYPDRKVLGVLIPAAETAAVATHNQKVGVLATSSTVRSGAFVREIKKILPKAQVFQVASPLLVPLIEGNNLSQTHIALDNYLGQILTQNIDTLILGSTHYPIVKQYIRQKIGSAITVISQDELLPQKLVDYLKHHHDIDEKLSRDGTQQFCITKESPEFAQIAGLRYGRAISLELVQLSNQ